MARFSLKALSLKNMPRKAILGIAAALAVTGATGAAALLAPSNLSQLIPSVSAQTIAPIASDDVSAQQPFDRVAQTTLPHGETIPTAAPEFTQQPQPPATATPARRTTDAAPTNTAARDFDRLARRATARVPSTQTQEAPAAQTEPTAEPQGRMIPTAAPGVIPTSKRVAQTPIVAPAKQIVRPRAVHVHTEFCND